MAFRLSGLSGSLCLLLSVVSAPLPVLPPRHVPVYPCAPLALPRKYPNNTNHTTVHLNILQPISAADILQSILRSIMNVRFTSDGFAMQTAIPCFHDIRDSITPCNNYIYSYFRCTSRPTEFTSHPEQVSWLAGSAADHFFRKKIFFSMMIWGGQRQVSVANITTDCLYYRNIIMLD